jgi:hypothetical protein
MPFKNEESKNNFYLIVSLRSLMQVETDSKTGYYWHDKNGQPTEDEKEVIERIPVEFPQYRDVESDADFQVVFDREFSNNKATDTDIFRKYHIVKVQDMLKEFTEIKDSYGWSYELIERTEKYIRFLSRKSVSSTQSPELNFADYLKHPDREIFAAKIKKEFPSIVNSGRDSAALYLALEKTEQMKYVKSNTAIFNAMTEYFGDIGNIKGFNSYLNPNSQNFINLKSSGIIETFINKLNTIR